MNTKSTFRIVLTALFAALTCVATMFIHIPTPTAGYVHLGDGFVLLSAFLLGPVHGMISAGIGSMLADILSGYPSYAVGTLIIKGLVALVAGLIYRTFNKEENLSRQVIRIVIASICGEIIMVLGYFAYSGIFLGYGLGAAAEIPGNLGQGAFGIIISAILTPVLLKSNDIREMLDRFQKR